MKDEEPDKTKTCDTCQYWGEHYENESGRKAFIPRCQNKLVAGNTFTGIHRQFVTVSAKFGCIHWESK